jgi:hypothetical protein
MLVRRKTSIGDATGQCGGCHNNVSNKAIVSKKVITFRKGLASTNVTKDLVTSHGHKSRIYPNPQIVVQRVPFFTGGVSTSLLEKKFQRPCIKRRSYNKQADTALKQCSLGQKRRTDGMARILARAGRPLSFKLQQDNARNVNHSEGSDNEDDEDDNKESDKPFEPLEVWKSPHLGGKSMGLPSQTYVSLIPRIC